MPRSIYRLSSTKVSKTQGPAKLCDGGGLWLYVTASGARNWVFRYRLNGRDREMGLGPLHTVSLADAREYAAKYRALQRKGIDPIAHRSHESSGRVTFAECAVAYIQAHSPAWKNKKHAAQWKSTLETYAYPVFGDVSVGNIDTASPSPTWQCSIS